MSLILVGAKIGLFWMSGYTVEWFDMQDKKKAFTDEPGSGQIGNWKQIKDLH